MELVIDYETFSACDLKTAGAIEYAKHPSTQIICAAYKIDDQPVRLWVPENEPAHGKLVYALLNAKVKLIAHNAGFEQAITRWVLTKYLAGPEQFAVMSLPHSRWKCTAAKAASHALPRNLEGACRVLGLKAQKDSEGNKLIKKYCKPRKPTKNNPSTRHDDPLDLLRIYEYCVSDVQAQYELDHAIPDLSPYEQKVWELDQRINFRGVKIDVPTVKMMIGIAEEETKKITRRINKLTKGKVTGPTKLEDLKDFVMSHGVMMPNSQAQTIVDILKRKDLPKVVRKVLELRQQGGKTSIGKYDSMLSRVGSDDRARDLLMYWGASTGRWTGKGIQVTNFPVGIQGLDTHAAIEVLKEGGPELSRFIYGDVMKVVSSCLRGMIIPEKGKEFFDADYASIEARICFWLAGHDEGLKAFREGKDQYIDMASVVFKRKITQKGFERDLGKRIFLGGQYGMGAKRFHETCAENNLQVTERLAKDAVNAYRKLHHFVPTMWKNLERAAIKAVRTKQKVSCHKVSFFVKGQFLYCKLPSGRKLAYHKPSVVRVKNQWGHKNDELRVWAEHPKTRQWVRTKIWGGALTENICQAISRCIMVESMMNLETMGYDVLFNVYDQLLSERTIGEGTKVEYEAIMTAPIDWAKGLPVVAEVDKLKRWKK